MQKITKTGRIVVTIGLLIMTVLLSSVAVSVYQGGITEEDAGLEAWKPEGAQHAVVINRPDLMPMVDSGKKDREGNPVMIRCNNCHDIKKPNTLTEDAAELEDFHQNMTFKHHSLKCASCHNPDDYESLRLADGTSVSFSNVMRLCAQCHGPQYRDYRNGSHGGMAGYWDLTRGPRKRNNCVECHDPHAPAYPKVMPVFPPKTRAGTKGGANNH